MTEREPEFCGCCGREMASPTDHDEVWCEDCAKHVGTEGHIWDQTYEAVHGSPCPFDVSRGRV